MSLHTNNRHFVLQPDSRRSKLDIGRQVKNALPLAELRKKPELRLDSDAAAVLLHDDVMAARSVHDIFARK
jgi:hypothetical protein